MTMTATDQTLIVQCPNCGIDVAWGEQSPDRPFCSPRCRDTDFIGWAKEEQRIVGDGEDILSGD
jgi:endogenous inhibitor of DNA gyrase (YacG/DUF329 family)